MSPTVARAGTAAAVRNAAKEPIAVRAPEASLSGAGIDISQLWRMVASNK